MPLLTYKGEARQEVNPAAAHGEQHKRGSTMFGICSVVVKRATLLEVSQNVAGTATGVKEILSRGELSIGCDG